MGQHLEQLHKPRASAGKHCTARPPGNGPSPVERISRRICGSTVFLQHPGRGLRFVSFFEGCWITQHKVWSAGVGIAGGHMLTILLPRRRPEYTPPKLHELSPLNCHILTVTSQLSSPNCSSWEGTHSWVGQRRRTRAAT